MLRVRNLPVKEENGRKNIAEFFGIDEKDVLKEAQPETFSIYILGNDYAISQYKVANPWGNTRVPKTYNFTGRLLVRWTGSKVQVL